MIGIKSDRGDVSERGVSDQEALVVVVEICPAREETESPDKFT